MDGGSRYFYKIINMTMLLKSDPVEVNFGRIIAEPILFHDESFKFTRNELSLNRSFEFQDETNWYITCENLSRFSLIDVTMEMIWVIVATLGTNTPTACVRVWQVCWCPGLPTIIPCSTSR